MTPPVKFEKIYVSKETARHISYDNPKKLTEHEHFHNLEQSNNKKY